MLKSTVSPDMQIISNLSKIISHLSTITSTSNLEELLNLVVTDTPALVNATACSIYLRPELVPAYNGKLLDENERWLKAGDLPGGFIVLAATSQPDMDRLIGHAFYASGDGLGGWVFAHAAPLRLSDRFDKDELRDLAPDLKWAGRNGRRSIDHDRLVPQPILIAPLVAQSGSMGIIVFPATWDAQPFPRTSEDVAVIVARIIAHTLEKAWVIREQSRHIRQLVDIGAKQNAVELFEAVTDRLGGMLGARRCRLYLWDNGGSEARLIVDSGQRVAAGDRSVFLRGQDLVGWVFKTGKPLVLEDIRRYAQGRELTEADLDRVSDGAPIDDDDRVLKCERSCATAPDNRPTRFLAAPVKSSDEATLGVLCADRSSESPASHTQPFSRNDLHLAQLFASTIALTIANERERRLGDLLTELGTCWDPNRMFDLVIQQVPDLVSGSGCCIYNLEYAGGRRLRLAGSSREGLIKDSVLADLTYDIGEGKTGFCALARATLVVNHYGAGAAARRALDLEQVRIRSGYRDDLIEKLLDEHRQRAGIIQLRRGAQTSAHVQREYANLARRLSVQPGVGLPSPKLDQYLRLRSRPSWSFVAVPIKTESDDLYGVITVGRPVERSPFSASDVTLLESIAGRLAAVLHNLKMQEQQKRLLMTLAHEINTPLQGILADTENLLYELPAASEQRELVRHDLDQVQQLHLLSETIMTVLSEQTPVRTFSIHSLYRPLKDACLMFESEAAAKGCDILEPVSHKSRFPDVEMSLFDLTLAFKNLIHNAVKYSFRPPRGQESNRYVRIVGAWADETHYSVGIQNYGVGVSPEEIESRAIFEPYYRGVKASDRRRTGAGLGLAHARQVIEDLHHGTIAVISKPMQGEAYLTTFVVTLPIRQPDAVRSPA